MKYIKLLPILFLVLIYSCPYPGRLPQIKEINPLVKSPLIPTPGPATAPTRTPEPTPIIIETELTLAGANNAPASFYDNEEVIVNFNLTISNTGNNIPSYSASPPPNYKEQIAFGIFSAAAPDLKLENLEQIQNDAVTIVLNFEDINLEKSNSINRTFPNINIADFTSLGNNYFYAVSAVVTTTDGTTAIGETNLDNNIKLIGSEACRKISIFPPYTFWAGPTNLPTSQDKNKPVAIPNLEEWFISDSANSYTVLYFSLIVEQDATYEIYMDNALEGTGAYNGNVGVDITYPGIEFTFTKILTRAYKVPYIFTATATEVKIGFFLTKGNNFAFGIHKQ